MQAQGSSYKETSNLICTLFFWWFSKYFYYSLPLGARSKHFDIPCWCLSNKTTWNWCTNKQQ